MTAPRLFAWAAATASLLSLANAQSVFIGGGPNGTNVLNNTCNRINAQSTIKDGSLWIDGGINTFTTWMNNDPGTRTPAKVGGLPAVQGQNQYVIQIPINTTWDWSGSTGGGQAFPANITEVALVKNPNPRTNSPPPVVEQAALFEGITGDPRIWLFGGNTPWNNVTFTNFQYPTVDRYALWSLNTSDNVWSQYDISSAVPYRPTNGANADAPDRGLAFWLNGQINSGSSQAAQVLGSYQSIFDDGLIVINLNGQQPTAQNISTAAMGWPRVGGSMQYVPTYGTEGLLVMIGGGNKSDTDHSADDAGAYIPLTDIWVYDVGMANETNSGDGFYFQTADGDVPAIREDFCVLGVESPGNSSYTIYMYGGRNGDTVYDDIYALSLPSFTWTRLYSGDSPRFGHQCHLANNRQMITVGGSLSTNLTTQCDWETRGVALYDLPSNNWGSVFIDNNDVGAYSLPQPVSDAIAVDAAGNPTKTAPSGGFSNKQLAMLFQESPSLAPAKQHSGLSGGAIAGIVIGVVAGLLIIAALVFFLVIRPRQAKRVQVVKEEDGLARPNMSELDDSEGSGNRSDDSAHAKMQERVETDGREVVALEKDGEIVRPEMADTEVRYEMDATDAEVRAELPTADTGKFGSDVKKALF